MSYSTIFKLGFLAGCMCLGGCASLSTSPALQESRVKLALDSAPSSVEVYTSDGELLGTTPLVTTVSVEQASPLLLYKPGFMPHFLQAEGTVNSVNLSLHHTNSYLYNLLVRERVRFVRRGGLDVVILEPANRPMSTGSTYTYFDPQKARDILLFVVEIGSAFVKLRTEDGATVYYPVINL